jgi:hypothetical protein
MEEMKNALFFMENNKALGPDNILVEFSNIVRIL